MNPAAPQYDADPVIQRYLQRFTGVTPSHPTDAALSEAEERLLVLAGATNEAIWDCNLETGIVWWNEVYERLFGRRGPDAAASDWWVVISKEVPNART